MHFLIQNKPAQTFYGLPYSAKLGDDFVAPWQYFFESFSPEESYGFSTALDTCGSFTYVTALKHPAANLQAFVLPAGSYAVFALTGPAVQTIPQAWAYAQQYLQIANRPSLEVYPAGNRMAEHFQMELWLPVERTK